MKKRWLFLFLLLLALLIGVTVIAPWREIIESRLKAMLESQGFADVHMTIESVGLNSAALKDISVGSPAPFTLKNLTLNYSLADLREGYLRELTLAGLTLEATQQADGQWRITGLEGWQNQGSGKKFTLPVTPDEMNNIHLGQASVEDGNVRVAAERWRLEFPLALSWQKNPVPQVNASTAGLTFQMPNLEIMTGATVANANLAAQPHEWQGTWRMENINIKSGELDIPMLAGAGTFTAQAERISLQGQFKNIGNTHQADLRLEFPWNDASAAKLVVIHGVMPWNEGTIAVRNTPIPLTGDRDIKLSLEVQHVAIDSLLQMLTGDRAKATGLVSGILPVTIKADGTIIVDHGKLQTEGPGTITMAPDAIPGDNEQIALVRDVLKNLHYTNLSITADSDAENKLSVRMTLEGNNPDVYGGKPVKLNVHLTGDVLDLVQQTFMSLVNPKLLLEMHEKANRNAK